MQKMLFAATVTLASVLASFATPASAANNDLLDTRTIRTIETRFSKLMELANKHDIKGLHALFWQSPAALLVAKSAIPSEGNWAGFWGNDAIDQKLHDIAASGPVVLTPDLSKLKIVGLTPDIAESYAPMEITVSYAGQDGTPKPFLMIINWKKIGKDWKVASEIILPVPSTTSATPAQ
ncbi:hypothetical protein FHS21_004595 [Phyllobacterium trifolii]|uniref:DUF4440 domain-containing protein n=1 Tax=Phyllobacterium trifolii TaxID=300193 RepID=A0A839UH82_9HYPH|nr:hypothetical protein [Phyllobacterium trifolii]MBB3148152.1 hypothetical protein [Phyllobacterium trifolii]